MSLGHLSILLTLYGACYRHVQREYVEGTKSQLTQTFKHSSGSTYQGCVAAANSCFAHISGAVAGACIGGAQQGQHQIAHIHSQLQPLHVPGHEASVKSCFIHTTGNVAATIIRSSQQGQNLLSHTHSQLLLFRVPGTCSRKFFVPHDFTPMFCHCNMPHQSSFGRVSCGMLQQRMLQKGSFLSYEQLRSARQQLTERFDQSQAAKNGNILS